MHPSMRKGPLFYKKTPLFSTFFLQKTPPPFHFLPTGLDTEKRQHRPPKARQFYVNMRLPHISLIAEFFAHYSKVRISHIFQQR